MVKKNFKGFSKAKLDALELNRKAIRIGWIKNPGPLPSGRTSTRMARDYKGRTRKITIAEVAAIHEFGGKVIPKRSSIRWVKDNKKAQIADVSVQWLAAMSKSVNVTPDMVLIAVAEEVIALTQARIVSKIPPPLRDSTIKRKKNKSTPLINTGQLKNSLRGKIIRGSQAFLGDLL